MTKAEVEPLFEKDMIALNNTQKIYETLLNEYQHFLPYASTEGNIEIVNTMSTQLVKIIETKIKLQLLKERC